MLHIYSGDGKGKTTAAVGLAVRCSGIGGNVIFVQFLKGQQSAETRQLERLGIQVLRDESTDKFVFQMSDGEKMNYRESQRQLLEQAMTCHKLADSEKMTLLVLDEVLGAIETGILEEQEVIEILQELQKHYTDGGDGDGHPTLEIVLTGRNPGERIVEMADYYTQMHMIRHPFSNGQPARSGIEY